MKLPGMPFDTERNVQFPGAQLSKFDNQPLHGFSSAGFGQPMPPMAPLCLPPMAPLAPANHLPAMSIPPPPVMPSNPFNSLPNINNIMPPPILPGIIDVGVPMAGPHPVPNLNPHAAPPAYHFPSAPLAAPGRPPVPPGLFNNKPFDNPLAGLLPPPGFIRPNPSGPLIPVPNPAVAGPPPGPFFPVTKKPRDNDPWKQQQYEAFLEWRKMNEPGFHMAAKQRQANRVIRRQGGGSTDGGSSTTN